MSNLLFACPHCEVELECDDQFAGREMECPTCHGLLVAPAPPPPPAPVPMRSHGRGTRPPPRTGPPSKSLQKKGGGSGALKKVLAIVVAVVGFGVGFYFAFGFVSKWQSKINETQDEAIKDSGGGQVGHIADLYDVLEKTDPENMEGMFFGGPIGAGEAGGYEGGLGLADSDAARNQMQSLPVEPPTYSLDPAAVRIPAGKVNGMISGTNFVVDTARVGFTQPYYVLSVSQGEDLNPERGILIYFRVQPGATVAGQKVTVTSDQTGRTLPKVTKRWKRNPNSALRQKSYSSGYSLVLEFGQPQGSIIPGRIYVALPDEEQTVVAGQFVADLVIEMSPLNRNTY